MNKEVLDQGSIELWTLEKITPYDKNAKRHSPEQVKKLAALIKRYGWTTPIVVQKSTKLIIAGHGRRLAALELGLKKVPVLVLDVSDDDARALRLADNRVSSNDYDASLVQKEIFDLKDLGFEIEIMGFDERELDFLSKDIAAFNDDAFVNDITEAVETQRKSNTAKEGGLDEEDAPLGKAFGFRRLTIGQGRRVKAWMAKIESESGKEGAEALMAYFDVQGIK